MKILSGMTHEDVSEMLVSAFNEVRDVMLDVKELFDETVESYTNPKEEEPVIEVVDDEDDADESVVSYTERVYNGDKLVSSTDKVWKNGELVVDEGTTSRPYESENSCCDESKKGADCSCKSEMGELDFIKKLNVINKEVDELKKTVDSLIQENERLEAENKRLHKLNEEYHEKAVKYETIKDLLNFA